MQDIRKPFNRSRSKYASEYEDERYDEYERAPGHHRDEPVMIPVRGGDRRRRNIESMDMYPRSRKDDDYMSDDEEDVSHNNEFITRDPRTRYKNNNHRHTVMTWLFVLAVVVIVLIVGLMTFTFNKATITITPKFEDIDIKKTLTLSSSGEGIPYILATSTIKANKVLKLSEAKKVEAKASGYIYIYNKFDTQPQRLIKNTRFESASGKIYRITESVIIPGKKGDTPGSVRALIVADGYGADWNTDPTDFTIPGFKDTPRYGGFFGRSDGALSGGASGDISIPSLADLNAAKDELTLELTQKVKESLAKTTQEGYIPMYSTVSVTVTDNEKDVLAGKTSAYEVIASGYLLLADQGTLARTLAGDVRDYRNEPVRLESFDSLTFTIPDTIQLENATSVKVLTEGKTRIVWVTDVPGVKKLFAGKSRGQYKDVMSSISSIQNGEISFTPLWLSTFPKDINKIKVIETLPKH